MASIRMMSAARGRVSMIAPAVDRTADEPGPEPAQRRLPARSSPQGALRGDQLALVATLELRLEGADDLHVGVAHPLAAAALSDLEERVDPSFLGVSTLVGHGAERYTTRRDDGAG